MLLTVEVPTAARPKTQPSEQEQLQQQLKLQQQESLVCVCTTMTDPSPLQLCIGSIKSYVKLVVVILWITELRSNPTCLSLVCNDQNEATGQMRIHPHPALRVLDPPSDNHYNFFVDRNGHRVYRLEDRYSTRSNARRGSQRRSGKTGMAKFLGVCAR
jgi:hypothetical protein